MALITPKRLALGAGAVALGVARSFGSNVVRNIVDRAASEVTDIAIGQITKTLTSTMLVSYEDSNVAYAAMNSWVAQNCELARRSIRVDDNEGSDVEVFGRIHVGIGEYWFRYRVADKTARRGYRVFVIKAKFMREELDRTTNPLVQVTVFGDRKGLVAAELRYMMEHANNGMQEVLSCSDYHFNTRYIPLRDLDSVILNGETKAQLLQHLNWFMGARPFFKNKGMTYKTAMLFHGPPGTGKTSMCRGIAKMLGYRIYLVKLEDIQRLAATNIKPKTMFVIEDIDKSLETMTAVREFEESRPEGSDPRVTMDINKHVQTFMQFLDGLLSADDTVTIITTNHPEVLPPEMMRVGRFNLKLLVDTFTETEAKLMCDSYNMPHTVLDEIRNEGHDWSVPAALNQALMERRFRQDSEQANAADTHNINLTEK